MQSLYKGKISNKQSKKKVKKVVDKFWENGLYNRNYLNLSSNFEEYIKTPTRQELDQVYKKMYKENEEDFKDCFACGYNSCEKMAVSIFNGLNSPENCHVNLEKIDNLILNNLSIVEALSEGHLNVNFEVTGQSEAAKLFSTFNHALQNISSNQRNIRNDNENSEYFTANCRINQ